MPTIPLAEFPALIARYDDFLPILALFALGVPLTRIEELAHDAQHQGATLADLVQTILTKE